MSATPTGPGPSEALGRAAFDTSPVFVACCARSGSTLLRWFLDSHPELSCPGETDVAVLLSSYIRLATDLAAGGGETSPAALGREVIDELMGTYLVRTGKSRWCDKSLSNVFHLDLLASTWPQARFVLLHRHCMDFVMSGIEASPWGLSEYGFGQVAQVSPTDSVVALVAYWVDRTTRMLAFEERLTDRCLRVRYEDLVEHTDEVLDEIWSFAGVDAVKDIASQAFEIDHSSFGPADHRIWYTSSVHHESIGRGARVPPDHVNEPLRTSANALLEKLGYPIVDDAWGSGALPPLPFDMEGASRAFHVEVRLVDGHDVVSRGLVDLSSATWFPHPEGAASPPRGDPARTVIAIERSVLAGICDGTENVGAALRARSVRTYGRLPRNFRDEREVFEHLAKALVANRDEFADSSTRQEPGRS